MYRSRTGRSASALALVLVAALAALGALAWFVGRGARSAAGPRASRPQVELPAEARGDVSVDDPDADEPSVEHPHVEGAHAARARPSGVRLEGTGSARIVARLRDGKSGAWLSGLSLALEEEPPTFGPLRSLRTRASAAGELDDDRVPEGNWTVTLYTHRYRQLDLGSHELRARRTLDLGTLSLEPLPVLRGRLLDVEGQPAVGYTLGLPCGDPPPLCASAEDGSFELIGDLPAHFWLEVRPPGPARLHTAQAFLLDRWPEAEPRELRLERWRRVVVRMYGAPSRVAYRLHLCHELDYHTEFCGSHHAGIHAHEPLVRGRELAPLAGSRRFEVELAPGSYALWAGVEGHKLQRGRIDVGTDLTDYEFAISGR